ncbi:glycosyltransferase [Anaerobacillus sp. 1_MG-2023]|uniref:glycosyltransferase n=1 Tax=Anaerobacillus sp. 1_MG-2023 TaxID=3062655 RepID=UPI0026E1EF51|nr:glycosyltransferase [Anaerobacillus sp. 1_MG-2023]MDO6657629.1 glycosyltransferase [Anaerobacillus sp. 1_MG-2023]
MKRISILFITNDVSHYIDKSTSYLIAELQKQSALTIWHSHGDIQSILSMLRVKPDFILMNDFHPTYGRYITGLENTDIPIGIMMHDLHYKVASRKRMMKRVQPSVIFTHYRDAFMESFQEFQSEMVWFPHHVPKDIFHDYKLIKDTDILMMGSMIPKLYPFRNQMYRHLKQRKGFLYHSHPGYDKEIESGVVGEVYARELNRAKLFLTCNSIYHYPLLKYVETLACNTLLLAPVTKELEDLGFKNEETFVAIDNSNFSEKVNYYLVNETERRHIAQKGIEMVRARHLTSIRVAEMIKHIHNVI